MQVIRRDFQEPLAVDSVVAEAHGVLAVADITHEVVNVFICPHTGDRPKLGNALSTEHFALARYKLHDVCFRKDNINKLIMENHRTNKVGSFLTHIPA